MNYSDLRPNKKKYAHPVLLRSHFRDKNLKPFYACIIMGKLGHNGRAPVALVYWLSQRLSGILFDIASDLLQCYWLPGTSHKRASAWHLSPFVWSSRMIFLILSDGGLENHPHKLWGNSNKMLRKWKLRPCHFTQ